MSREFTSDDYRALHFAMRVLEERRGDLIAENARHCENNSIHAVMRRQQIAQLDKVNSKLRETAIRRKW